MKKTKLISLNKQTEIKSNKVVYPKVRLLFDHILTTSFTKTVTASGVLLQDNKGNILTDQTVVAIGPNADVKVGDKVEIDPTRFKVQLSAPKNDIGPDNRTLIVPLEEIENEVYLFLSMRELKWVYDEGSVPGK